MLTFRALIRAMIALVVQCLAILLFACPACSQTDSINYVFLLASGFLCDTGDSSTCPATAKANSGDSYEMSGAGTFDPQNRSISATGTFTHKSPNGNILERGVWIAAELTSFDSYGAAPEVLLRQGLVFNPASFDAKRLPMYSGPVPTGGLAVFRIRLLSMQGTSTTAVLHVNCALGDVPRKRSVEGIRLKLEGSNNEYLEEMGGRVMFLATRPEVSAPAKAHRKSTSETSETPRN